MNLLWIHVDLFFSVFTFAADTVGSLRQRNPDKEAPGLDGVLRTVLHAQ